MHGTQVWQTRVETHAQTVGANQNKKLCAGTSSNRFTYKSVNGKSTCGGHELNQSAAYTSDFARAVYHAWKEFDYTLDE